MQKGGKATAGFLKLWAMVCLAASLSACPGGEAPKKENLWRLFAQTEDYKFFYDVNSIDKGSRGTVGVDVKRTLREDPQIINELTKGIARELKKRQKAGMSIRGYENWEYELVVCRIDCRSGLIRFLKSANYDNRGKLIDQVVVPDSVVKWEKIVPDTINDTLRREMCKAP